MYKILEISLADTGHLFRYKLEDVYHTDFGIKGFDYPWIQTSLDFEHGPRSRGTGGLL
jgi:hypothetical protein